MTRRNLLQSVSKTSSSHAGLWLDKYITSSSKDDADTAKKNLVEDLVKNTKKSDYGIFYARWQEALKALKAEQHPAHTKTRMIVGLGTESVLETSISLHHTYGVPYIPGSALKGLAAHYAAQAVEGLEYGSEHHKILFGDTTQAGLVTFFDALPIPEKYQLHQDVLTPHHSDYYVNATPTAPADWDSPIPVPMLAASGSFLIAVACPDEGWTNLALSILEAALENYGIGAKTSSGYGRLKLENTKKAQAAKDQRKIDSLRPSIKNVKVADIKPQISPVVDNILKCQDAGLAQELKLHIDKLAPRIDLKKVQKYAWYEDLAKLAESAQ